MRTATDFEYRHQKSIHLLIVTLSFLTYLIDRDDIVWALVKGTPYPRLLERLLFALAAMLIGVSATLRTWALASPLHSGTRYPQQLGNLVFSIGLGFFAPISGFVILVVSESIVAARLVQRERRQRGSGDLQSTDEPPVRSLMSNKPSTPEPGIGWAKAFQRESSKWGLFLTMIVFVVLLQDRVAEILAGLSFLIWLLLNGTPFQRLASR